MATKKISVNPEFFKMGGSKTLKRNKKKRAQSARNMEKKENKQLKMKLISKIKEHKQKNKERGNQTKGVKDNGEEFENDLNSSLNYLQNLSSKHKSRKEKRRERKLARRLHREQLQQSQLQQSQLQQVPMQQVPMQQFAIQPIQQPQQQFQTGQVQMVPIKINTPPTSFQQALNTPLIQTPSSGNSIPQPNAYIVNNSKPDPPYGILKHGRKPLFSTYNKTLKKPSDPINKPNLFIDNLNVENGVSIHTDSFFDRKQKLNQLKQQVSTPVTTSFMSSILKPGKTLKRMKQLKTTTKRFIHLGKKNGKVGVLIKNQKTRKKILKDTNTLKKRPLSKIKNYLRKHNLIKIGSTAPEHIIRSMYENSFLAGDIYNKNVDTLLHNYLDV